MAEIPTIPEYITVHLGAPNNPSAANVVVNFADYIKNVASSEIYPTWPESAIRANIYAQVSYALNRVYTEWYRSRGYDFDITNSTQYDQAYQPSRDIFANVSAIVDEIFDSYLVRPGNVEPMFAQYCNGTTVTCDGLSQWGTVPLAEEGLGPYDILTRFYGENLSIVTDVPIETQAPSYPGTALRVGTISNEVRDLQVRLNRISTNYPAIPKIYPVNGIFDINTENAVRKFQEIFNLTVDGIVGKSTWYSVLNIYNSVKRLSELDSEGLTVSDISRQFPRTLEEGDDDTIVRLLQYYLSRLSAYISSIPAPQLTGVFDAATTNAVQAFQQYRGLPDDGIVTRVVWDIIEDTYDGIMIANPASTTSLIPPYPGRRLFRGLQGEDVQLMQEYLNYISQTYPEVPSFPVTGYYGDLTADAVVAFQNRFNLEPSGAIGPITWETIASTYESLRSGSQTSSGQYPGYPIGEGATT